MLKRINSQFQLTIAQETHLAAISHANMPTEWDKTNQLISTLKKSINSQLNTIQNEKCCYCGLQLWETSRGEIEHIAPKKGRPKAYPEFTFTKKNLALACEYCNGSSKKGQKNIILRYNANYDNCEFKLVHPYFDEPKLHYEWVNNKTKIQIRHKTWKGKYSIILFGLDQPSMSNARGKQHIYERKVTKIAQKQKYIDLFKRIITFKR